MCGLGVHQDEVQGHFSAVYKMLCQKTTTILARASHTKVGHKTPKSDIKAEGNQQGRVVMIYFEFCEQVWGGSSAKEQIDAGIGMVDMENFLDQSKGLHHHHHQ